MNSRALAAVRLSVKKDDSTSPERQKLAIRRKADSVGAEVVGTAEDLNVSASKIGPFQRPKLGEWLRLRSNEYDTIIFWRLDRAARSMRDLNELIAWTRDNKKRLIFCEGQASSYNFDFRTADGKSGDSLQELLVMIIAWAAQVESEAISERVTSSHKYLRENGEWGGGVVPYGFIPEAKAKRGYRLVPNPETMPVLQEIIRRVLRGEHLLPICRDLNARGVPTPRDSWEQHKGRQSKGRKWNTPGMKLILQSRSLLGEWHFDGQRVYDDQGNAVERSAPVVSVGEFRKIQDSLIDLSMAPKQKYEDPNPLLGVALCARCGQPYYLKQEKQKGRVYKSFSCRSRHGDQQKSCGQPTLSFAYATAIAEEVVLSSIGDLEVQEREFIAADDKTEERDRLLSLVKSLEKERDRGLILDEDDYFARKVRIVAQIKEIGDEVVRPAGYIWHGTGRTYNEVWPDLDMTGRLKLMNDLGIKIYLGRGESVAADVAWVNQGDEFPELPEFVRVARFYDEATAGRVLADVQDGARIKKDFRVWALQSGTEFPHNIIAEKASHRIG